MLAIECVCACACACVHVCIQSMHDLYKDMHSFVCITLYDENMFSFEETNAMQTFMCKRVRVNPREEDLP